MMVSLLGNHARWRGLGQCMRNRRCLLACSLQDPKALWQPGPQDCQGLQVTMLATHQPTRHGTWYTLLCHIHTHGGRGERIHAYGRQNLQVIASSCVTAMLPRLFILLLWSGPTSACTIAPTS